MKELKKKHPSRLVEGAEMGSQGMERQQFADQVVPYLCVDKLGGTTGEWDRPLRPGFQYGQNKASERLAVKIWGGCGGGRNC